MHVGIGSALLMITLLLAVGALPTWPYSRSWDYGPSSSFMLVSLFTLLLVLTGRL